MSTPTPFGYSDPLAFNETRIQLPQNNDAVLTFTVTDPNNNNAIVNLTGATVKFWRKPSRQTSDTDPSVISYAGSLVAPPTNGMATVAVPEADNAIAGVTWWRFDVTLAGKTRTANYGPLEVIPV